MRFHRLVIALVMASAPLMAWGQGVGLESIRKSTTVSEAVSAYGRAVGMNTDITLAQQAFLTRMIELKSPALAEEQAKEITQWTNDGQAWAVLAFVEAQKDHIEPSMDLAIKSLKYSAGNEFALRTAGQIVAWYDVRDDQDALGESAKQKAQQLQKMADRSRAYSRAYDTAKRVLTEGVETDGDVSMPVQIVGSLEELGTYSGYTAGTAPGLVSYWSMPSMYPGYDLEPWWADYNYTTSWAFPPVRLRNVSREVRYMRMPGNQGFLLVDGLGATIVPTDPVYWRQPYYGWQRDPWFVYGYPGPILGYPYSGFGNRALGGPGYYPVATPYYGYGYGYGAGYGAYGSVWNNRPQYFFTAAGTSRLAQRMGNGLAFPGMLASPPGLGGGYRDGIGAGLPGWGGGRGGGRGGRGPR